ncbi:MAG: hypothetical protein ABSH20_18065 [Tepidisphaeraceae bacterium]
MNATFTMFGATMSFDLNQPSSVPSGTNWMHTQSCGRWNLETEALWANWLSTSTVIAKE